jgi:hypothetical protein
MNETMAITSPLILRFQLGVLRAQTFTLLLGGEVIGGNVIVPTLQACELELQLLILGLQCLRCQKVVSSKKRKKNRSRDK